MISIGDGKDLRVVNSQFLIVPYRSVYNYFLAMLDVVASMMYLKVKYHNLQREPTIISPNLKWEKIIY